MDVTFSITDEVGNSLPVAYTGTVGQLFFNDHSELILEGQYGENGVFDVKQLVIKCPSKYVEVQDVAGEEVAPDYSDPDITTETYTSNSGA
jgi:cytochrome c-type biogenesis protein CcmE